MLIYFDLETTGLNQYYDKITDLCFLQENYSTERLSPKFLSLINPERHISGFITRLTGITNEMVATQPTFPQICPSLLNFVNESPETKYLVAHNCDGFDKLVLLIHFKNTGIDVKKFNWKYIDTLLFAKKLYSYMSKYNLKKLITELGLDVKNAHRAEADTLMLRDLYRKMCYDLAKQEKLSYDELLRNPEFIWNYIYD